MFMKLIQKVLNFNGDEQLIGLSQFKVQKKQVKIKKEPSIKAKDIKLSDLMRRVS